MAEGTISLSKKKILLFLAVLVILFAFIFYFYDKKGDYNLFSAVQEYKKAIYTSLLCQYSCELIETDFNGGTTFVPDSQCTIDCINKLKERGYSKDSFTSEELLEDDLLKDIDLTIKGCREKFGAVTDEALIPDVKSFYDCSKKGLTELESKYSYVKTLDENSTS